MYGTRVLGAPGTGGIVSSISWSRTRTSGATEKSRIPLQVCAYPQAGKYSEMASQRGVVNREVLISAMHDTTSNPPLHAKTRSYLYNRGISHSCHSFLFSFPMIFPWQRLAEIPIEASICMRMLRPVISFTWKIWVNSPSTIISRANRSMLSTSMRVGIFGNRVERRTL